MEERNPPPASELVSSQLAENRKRIEELFSNCHDLKLQSWGFGADLQYSAFSVYLDTLTETKHESYMKATLQDLSPLLVGTDANLTPEIVRRYFEGQGVTSYMPMISNSFDQTVKLILRGQLAIFIDNWNHAICYDMPGIIARAVSEPVTESVVFGPHNSTIEDLHTNIGLLRGLLRTTKLKFESFYSGVESDRQIVYGYLEGTVDPTTLAEFKSKMSCLGKQEILDTSYLEEWVEGSTFSPFPQVRYTERPDVANSALLEGKIIVLVQGTPSIMICPGLFVEFFSASEDYYQRTIYASLVRWLRISAFAIALMLPSLYIALSTYHPELIPTVLLLAILDTREKIPFPAFVEALIMEFFFELLREAGIRLPRPIGSAVSIVGALVVGQAAIQAKISSPIMIIVVALTGIASFALPQYNLGIALRILRFPLMMLAATLGGFGLMIGYFMILLHITRLRVLGVPYLSSLAPLQPGQLIRDFLFRAPIKLLQRSPRKRPFHE
ncbi:MAG: spore gernimation protein [Paenibacillus sp.]|jgi:spore germination protein KA|nr:spore gernimation protein [Paenibacillus sp.]